MTAARAITLVAEVSNDAHIAEAVAARSEESVLDDLHANRAQEILVGLRHETLGGGSIAGGGELGEVGFDGGDERPRGELVHGRGMIIFGGVVVVDWGVGRGKEAFGLRERSQAEELGGEI